MEHKHRILVVDDTPANIKILNEDLKKIYHISVAKCGLDALELAEQETPDLILLDIMMPEMDGYEVCRRLKSNKTTAKIPIIFVTAKSEDIDEQHGLSLGAIDYITKPFSIPVTKARIHNHLELKIARDNLEELVAERTRELRLANIKLAKYIKELEGRDLLTRLQTSGASQDETGIEICRIVLDVIGAPRVILYYPDKLSNQLLPALLFDPALSNSPQIGKGIDEEAIVISHDIAMQAMQQKKLVIGPSNDMAVPVCFSAEFFGVIWVADVNLDKSIGDNQEILHRLSNDAAAALRWARINEDILFGRMDLNKILGVNQYEHDA